MATHHLCGVAFVCVATVFGAVASAAGVEAPGRQSPLLLLQQPTVSRDEIVFVFAGDLWRVPRSGGVAARLTAHPGQERDPRFSPDGSWIAFTAQYDGNTDVYVIPADGGVPARLTSHPGEDRAIGWTNDGTGVLFRSPRNNPNDGNRLFVVPRTGGLPTELPLPLAEEGSYSPDGTHLAYVPTYQWQRAWKRYRGGQTRRVWIADLADSSTEELPRNNSNDFNPMWRGDTVYLLSDRNGPVTLFACDRSTKAVRQLVENTGFDLKSASLGPDVIVYEQFGSLHLFDLSTLRTTEVAVSLTGDISGVRSRLVEAKGGAVQNGRLSATGQRAVFEIRGEIITVPADKGDARNLTRTPGVAERDPAWSPDGRWIAFFSDASGEYALHLCDQAAMGQRRVIPLPNPSFCYSPAWAPDSKHLAFADKHLRLWVIDVDSGTPVVADTAVFYNYPNISFCGYSWSPDSRWLAYSKTVHNRLHVISLYRLEDRVAYQVTDGMGDAVFPTFDVSGKYLFFAASTDIGPAAWQWGDLSAANRPVTRSLYCCVLDRSLPSPLAAESSEEMPGAVAMQRDGLPDDRPQGRARTAERRTVAPKSESAKKSAVVRIDLDGLGQRTVALPMPARNYKGLAAGTDGILWVVEGPLVEPMVFPPTRGPELTLWKCDLTERDSTEVVSGLHAFDENGARSIDVSADGGRIMYRKGDDWYVEDASAAPAPDAHPLAFTGLQLEVDPRAEWHQMYREVWRTQREFFYDPGLHGLDLATTYALYEPFVDGLGSRADLNYLFEEMLGELSVGHVFVEGGDVPEVAQIRVGLLGADYALANGRYRIARIYGGENWNPSLRAPLTEPGINVEVGDYLLAVDGRQLTDTDEIYALFQDKADRIVTLRVSRAADGTGAREVRVRPVSDEKGLRNRAWMEDNRRRVVELSQGQLGYVYLPDTWAEGYTNLNRYYFAQIDKVGFVIDERHNRGGLLDDYAIDYLRRPVLCWAHGRDGSDYPIPLGANHGPQVMLINEFAGSGGDALPWYFRSLGLGHLVGKRTWGGLVGTEAYPRLLDGGYVTAPSWAIYGLKGEWEVENTGIAPDIDVELDPALWRQGRDAQLEKAVEVALDELRKDPPRPARLPPFPNYHRQAGP